MSRMLILMFIMLFSNMPLAQQKNSVPRIDCEIDTVYQRIASHHLNADFKQLKHIRVLKKPLISYGQIWLSDLQQMVWQVSKPLKSTLVINQGELHQFDYRDQRLKSKQHPMMKQLGRVFIQLFSGTVAELKTSFDYQLNCKNSNFWELVLKPKDDGLKQVLAEVKLMGSIQLEQLSYTEARGDKTELILTPQPESLAKSFETYLD